MMATIGDFVEELRRSSADTLWGTSNLKDIKDGEKELDFESGNSLAKGCLDFSFNLKAFLESSADIPHEHIGTSLYLSHAKLLGTPDGLRRITVMAGAFDQNYPLDSYVTAARESYVYQYMAVFSLNLVERLLTSLPDDAARAEFLSKPYETQVNIDYPEAE